MKYLIVPDIHNKVEEVEVFIQAVYDTHKLTNENCTIIFLGDYFDNFHDTTLDAEKVAWWLKRSIDRPNRIHLIGNHDLGYMYDNKNHTCQCAGYKDLKKMAINTILTTNDWNELDFYHRIDTPKGPFLFTHAGLSAHVIVGEADARGSLNILKRERDRSRAAITKPNHKNWFWHVGPVRSLRPDGESGGILWCHFPQEFEGIPGLNQIFGHTPANNVRVRNEMDGTVNICCDTHLKNMVLIDEKGEVTVI